MQRWSYGLNGYWRTASVWLEEGPCWAFWLAEAPGWLCARMPTWRIPLLDRIKIVRDEEETTWGDWYGDCLHSLWHSFVCDPLFQFAYRHIKQKDIPMEWDACKALFYEEDKDWWDEEEREGEEMRRKKPLDEMAKVLESMGMPRPDRESA